MHSRRIVTTIVLASCISGGCAQAGKMGNFNASPQAHSARSARISMGARDRVFILGAGDGIGQAVFNQYMQDRNDSRLAARTLR